MLAAVELAEATESFSPESLETILQDFFWIHMDFDGVIHRCNEELSEALVSLVILFLFPTPSFFLSFFFPAIHVFFLLSSSPSLCLSR